LYTALIPSHIYVHLDLSRNIDFPATPSSFCTLRHNLPHFAANLHTDPQQTGTYSPKLRQVQIQLASCPSGANSTTLVQILHDPQVVDLHEPFFGAGANFRSRNQSQSQRQFQKQKHCSEPVLISEAEPMLGAGANFRSGANALSLSQFQTRSQCSEPELSSEPEPMLRVGVNLASLYRDGS